MENCQEFFHFYEHKIFSTESKNLNDLSGGRFETSDRQPLLDSQEIGENWQPPSLPYSEMIEKNGGDLFPRLDSHENARNRLLISNGSEVDERKFATGSQSKANSMKMNGLPPEFLGLIGEGNSSSDDSVIEVKNTQKYLEINLISKHFIFPHSGA